MRQWLMALGIGLMGVAHAASAEDDHATARNGADPSAFSSWQGRVSLGTPSRLGHPLGVRAEVPNSATVFGDYYFGAGLAPDGQLGGVRATSGLMFGPRSSLGFGQAARASGTPISVGRMSSGSAPLLPGDREPSATVPYLGLGYTGWAARSGWSYSADLGLAGQQGLRLGRGGVTGANLDDAIRDLKMAPLVQVGVTYAF